MRLRQRCCDEFDFRFSAVNLREWRAGLKVRVLRENKERTLQHNTMDVNEKHNTVYKDTRKMREREWGRKAVNKSGPFQDPCVCFNRGM